MGAQALEGSVAVAAKSVEDMRDAVAAKDRAVAFAVCKDGEWHCVVRCDALLCCA